MLLEEMALKDEIHFMEAMAVVEVHLQLVELGEMVEKEARLLVMRNILHKEKKWVMSI